MTDSERQRLCDWLRHLPSYLSEDGMQAAEEIERLAALVQPGVELKAVVPSDAFTDLATKLVTVCLQNIEQKMPYDLMVGEVAATLASVAQSDAEPVAWLYRYPADGVEEWSFTLDKEHANEREIEAGCIVENLYTVPPRPDAARSGIERLVQERKMERLVQERDNALTTLKAHGIMK